MMEFNINASNISPWPGFSLWVQVLTSNVLAMAGTKQNLEIKGGPSLLPAQVHVFYCNN